MKQATSDARKIPEVVPAEVAEGAALDPDPVAAATPRDAAEDPQPTLPSGEATPGPDPGPGQDLVPKSKKQSSTSEKKTTKTIYYKIYKLPSYNFNTWHFCK